jgi:predicted RNA-binding protein with PIN domain
MSLHYIIDAYNVINHPTFSRSHKKIKDCRRALLDFIMINRLCGSSKNSLTVVFDGFPPPLESSIKSKNTSLIFSQEDSADNVIKRLVEESREPRNIRVVSDDKEIRLFIKFFRASSLSVEEFINRPQKAGDSRKTYMSLSELKPELNQAQILKINQELERRWLK